MTGKKDRRSEILGASQRCLAKYGYSKMTMEDVGKEVGLNKASLYYYFPSKEALVSAVISSEAKEYLDELQAKVESVPGCRKRIAEYLVERYRIYQKVNNLHNLSVQDIRQLAPTLKKIFVDWQTREINFIKSIIDECVRRGELAACDSRRIARSIVSIANAYKNELISSPDTDPNAPIDYSSIEDDAVFTVTLLLDGLRVSDS